MNPQPLRERIPAVLHLAPMTIADLAVALWVTCSAVEHALADLRASGDVKCAGTLHRKNGAPRKIWRLDDAMKRRGTA